MSGFEARAIARHGGRLETLSRDHLLRLKTLLLEAALAEKEKDAANQISVEIGKLIGSNAIEPFCHRALLCWTRL